MNTATLYKHIVLNDKVGPIIEDTNQGVVNIVLYMKAFGWSPEKIHLEYPNLSLGQIHSALAYYWDHQEELDADIERRVLEVGEIIHGHLQPDGKTITILDKEQAKQLAIEKIAKVRRQSIEEVNNLYAIVDSETIEKDYGWIFLFATHIYLKTKDPMYALPPGFGPLLVRKDGAIAAFSTGKPFAESILAYEKGLKKIEKNT